MWWVRVIRVHQRSQMPQLWRRYARSPRSAMMTLRHASWRLRNYFWKNTGMRTCSKYGACSGMIRKCTSFTNLQSKICSFLCHPSRTSKIKLLKTFPRQISSRSLHGCRLSGGLICNSLSMWIQIILTHRLRRTRTFCACSYTTLSAKWSIYTSTYSKSTASRHFISSLTISCCPLEVNSKSTTWSHRQANQARTENSWRDIW